MFVLILFVFVSPVCLTTIPPLPACDQLKYTYSSRGVPEYDIPGRPVQGLGLQFCPSGPTCCTRAIEEKLGAWSEQQYRDAIFNRTTSMAAEIDRKAQQIDDFVYSLLNKAQRGFHDMFTRTYGIMYQKNANVFQDYFKDLKVYYDRGTLDLGETTTNFFNILYQKMFQVLNSQYTFDSLYMSCVSENMQELQPFGDVPRKLSSSVKRSLVAARALVRALKTGHEVANLLTKVEPSPGCLGAVKKMSSCPACKGLPEVKPCNGYCINIMKGCMAHHYELDEIWNAYIESLLSLTERLIGPFNLEMTIDPISIKISDAIMNFQESGFQVTQKVFEQCGTPRLSRREAQSSQFVFEKRLEKIHRTPARPAKSEFEIMLMDLKKNLKSVEGFWSLLPYQMCDTQMEKPYRNIRDRSSCWNGKDVGNYEGKVLEDGLRNQVENPEVPVSQDTTQTILEEQKVKLQGLSNQLKSAYRGLDIEWWDDTGKGTRDTQDDEGSGEFKQTDLYDDEDYGELEGSGKAPTVDGSGAEPDDDDHDEDLVVPTWHKEKKPKPFDPFQPRSTEKPDTSVETSITAGSGRAVTGSKLRAVASFLVPIFTCYIGSVFTDIPHFLT